MNDRPLRFLMAAFILISLISLGPVMAVPTPPSNLQAESRTNGDIYLSWSAVTGATSYLVYMSTISSIPASYEEVSGTNITLTIGGDGLVNGTTWYFWVKAKDGSGTSSATGPVNTVCDASPPLPVSLASPLNGSYVISNPPTLEWSATTDDSSHGDGQSTGVDYYELQYSTTSDFTPSTTMTVSSISGTEYTPAQLPNGTYYWRVRAVDNAGNALNWTDASVTVRSFIVNMVAPTLLTPANGSSLNGEPAGELPPTFSWTEVSGANGYLLEIDDETPISATPLYSFNVSGGSTTSYTPIVVFGDDTYYWRVSATDGGGTSIGVYSSVWSFSVDSTAPGAPTLTSPTNGATTGDATPQLTWGSVTDAVAYYVEISSSNVTDVDGSFSSVENTSGALTTNSYSPTSDLADGLHYWHVRAKDSADNYSSWSSVWSFTVDTTLPEVPTLATPASGSTVESARPTFTWSAVTGATSYYLQISTSSSFASYTVNQTVTTTTYQLTSAQSLSNGTYYWRVSSNLDEDGYSSVWSIIIDVEATEQPVSFTVEVRAGATGELLNNATVTVLYGPTTIDSATTDTTGRVSLQAPLGSYTLRVVKNLWDSGDGETYSKQVTLSASGEVLYVNLYQTGRDLLVASVHYNDKTSSSPSSVVIYRDGVVYSTVTLPSLPPTSMIPTNLTLAKTNLVIEVPNTGTYSIADPSYTDGKVTISDLSQTLSSAYVNTVTIQITSSINGMIVDELGSNVTGVSVMLLRQSDNAIMGAVETSTIGFLFNLILPGTYYVRAQKTGYDTTSSDTFDVGPHETTNIGLITMTQEKGTLNITIQTSGGSLLDNVTVKVTDSGGTEVFNQLVASGIVGFELPTGTYTLSATKAGYELEETVSALVVAGDTASKTLIMNEETEPEPETGSIQISVTDGDGNPLQLVNVYIGGEKVGVTNQDGILLLEGQEPTTYQVTLKKDGYEDVSFSVSVTAGSVSTSTKGMEETVEPEASSRMQWILIAAAVVIVFAIVLLALTKRKGEKEEPSGPSEAPSRPQKPSPEEKRSTFPSKPVTSTPGGHGIPMNSAREQVQRKEDVTTGGIPTRSIK